MVGDDLTIALFLISLAGSVAVGGITQAGWKNRPLIISLFVISIVLFCAGLAWPLLLKDLFPSIKLQITEIAKSPIAWFVLLMFGFGAAVFTPPRLRRETAPSVEGESRSVVQTVQPEPPLTEKILVPVDIYYLHDPTAHGYPHKLCIALKNESGKDLLVNPARWETRAASDLAVRRTDEHPWTPEGPDGWERRNWIWSRSPGNAPIHVSGGRAIQTWVGLHGRLDDIELTQRIIGKRLGTLLVSFTANGNAGSETIKL